MRRKSSATELLAQVCSVVLRGKCLPEKHAKVQAQFPSSEILLGVIKVAESATPRWTTTPSSTTSHPRSTAPPTPRSSSRRHRTTCTQTRPCQPAWNPAQHCAISPPLATSLLWYSYTSALSSNARTAPPDLPPPCSPRSELPTNRCFLVHSRARPTARPLGPRSVFHPDTTTLFFSYRWDYIAHPPLRAERRFTDTTFMRLRGRVHFLLPSGGSCTREATNQRAGLSGHWSPVVLP